jgi:methionyl-tRNA formyltransferase
MDSELDTGNLLAQSTVPIEDDDVDIAEFGGRLLAGGVGLLPQVFERVAAGDPGDPQPEEGASWAGHFEDDDYARVDWSRTAREIHNQVRAWHLTFGLSDTIAPVAELDGERLVLRQTRLTDPGGDARRVECGDGPIWIVASDPA